MKNNFLKVIEAIDEAGLELVNFKKEGNVTIYGVTPSEDKSEQTLPIHSGNKKFVRFPGESYDICHLLGADDWRDAISKVNVLPAEKSYYIHEGDFLYVSFDVPAVEYDGVKFKELNIESAKVQVIEKSHDKIIFGFDEIIFKSAINAKDTNKGGFSESALAKYLNNEFLNAMCISEHLVKNNEGIHITLPTATELFGDEDYWENTSNFHDKPKQFDFYTNEKNRVRVFENETQWYWTSSPRASSASGFCNCSRTGLSTNLSASSAGGVAPAFCVA
jgi:hypothetical protein